MISLLNLHYCKLTGKIIVHGAHADIATYMPKSTGIAATLSAFVDFSTIVHDGSYCSSSVYLCCV